jgi:hypothetical protein
MFPFEVDHQILRRNRCRPRDKGCVSEYLELAKLKVIAYRQWQDIGALNRQWILSSDHNAPEQNGQKRPWEQTFHEKR